MKLKNNLFELLEVLNKKELNFIITNNYLNPIQIKIIKYYNTNKTRIIKQNLWKSLYSSPYNDDKLRKLFHKTYHHIIYLLGILYSDADSNKFRLAKIFKGRGNFSLYQNLISDLNTSKNNFNNYYQISEQERFKNTINREIQVDYETIHNKLDFIFLIEKLEWIIEEIHQKRIIKIQSVIDNLLNELGVLIEKYRIKNTLIDIYLCCIELHTSDDNKIDLFNKIENYIDQEKHLESRTLHLLFDTLINYTLNDLKIIELKTLYLLDRALKKNAYIIDGFLDSSFYLIVIILHLDILFQNVHKISFTLSDIEKMALKLSPYHYNDYYNYSLGIYYQYHHNLSKSLFHYNQVSLKEHYIIISIKISCISILYEIGDIYQMNREIQNLRKYIKKSVISDRHIENVKIYLQGINLLKKNLFDELQGFIVNNPNLSMIKWFQRMVNERK